uniref:hypothetical protein n=1 Tax=Blautia stercoris TaxID=871664 RepID=UPI0040254E18
KADIRNPLRYLLMNAVASQSVSESFQLPLTEASPLSRRLVLRALKAGECLSAFKHLFIIFPNSFVCILWFLYFLWKYWLFAINLKEDSNGLPDRLLELFY